jgi:hypothetical protein
MLSRALSTVRSLEPRAIEQDSCTSDEIGLPTPASLRRTKTDGMHESTVEVSVQTVELRDYRRGDRNLVILSTSVLDDSDCTRRNFVVASGGGHGAISSPSWVVVVTVDDLEEGCRPGLVSMRKMTEKRNRGNQRISNIIHNSPRICSSRAVDSACNTRRSSGSLCMRVWRRWVLLMAQYT